MCGIVAMRSYHGGVDGRRFMIRVGDVHGVVHDLWRSMFMAVLVHGRTHYLINRRILRCLGRFICFGAVLS